MPAVHDVDTQLNSTQLNFIDERIKTTTDIVIKINTNYSETDTSIKATCV